MPDLYLKNPAWRELLLLGNFNAADYEAFVVEVVRRQYRNWQLNGSYTWSIARGDAEDFDLLLGNELNRRDDEAGFLSYDQRHVVKLNLATHTPWNFDFGAVMRWESGLPFSIVKSALVSHNIPNIFPYEVVFAGLPRFRFPSGRRNDQRNPSFWTLDLRLTRDFPIGRTNLLQLSVEAFNVFNDDTLRLESRTDNRLVGSRRFGRRWQVGMKLAF